MRLLLLFLFLLIHSQQLHAAKHRGPAYDVNARVALDTLGEKLAKQHNLKMLNTGLGYLADAPEAPFAINFTSNQNLTIEQAQLVVADIIQKMLYDLYHHPVYNEYCRMRPKELQNNLMAFKMAFWNAEMNRPLYPYLAQIRYTGSAVYYHYADPHTQALQKPIEKSLQETITSELK